MTIEEARCLCRRPPAMWPAAAALLQSLPPGRLTTFGDLARGLGDVAAARWLASEFSHLPLDGPLPIARVLRQDGSPGGRPGRRVAQRTCLAAEGFAVERERVRLDRPWRASMANPPLERLRAAQRLLAANVSVDSDRLTVPLDEVSVAGLDVSYRGRVGCAAFAPLTRSGADAGVATLQRDAPFPYIPSYLAFRELPLHLELLESLPSPEAELVLVVDGAGYAHPRRAGIASLLGVILDRPTIGVTKKLLCGRWDESLLAETGRAPVKFEGETIAEAILPPTGARRPLFVSAGHRITLATAVHVVERHWTARLPEPIRCADAASRSELARR